MYIQLYGHVFKFSSFSFTFCFITPGNDRMESAQLEYFSQFAFWSPSCMAFSVAICWTPPPLTSSLLMWFSFLLTICRRFAEMMSGNRDSEMSRTFIGSGMFVENALKSYHFVLCGNQNRTCRPHEWWGKTESNVSFFHIHYSQWFPWLETVDKGRRQRKIIQSGTEAVLYERGSNLIYLTFDQCVYQKLKMMRNCVKNSYWNCIFHNELPCFFTN